MTKDEYLSLFPEDPHTLYVEPARAAAEILAEAWSGMEPEAQSTRHLYNDLSEIIKILKEWRINILEHAGAQFVEQQFVVNDYMYDDRCGLTACVIAIRWPGDDCMLKLEYVDGYVHWLNSNLVKPVK